MKRKLLFFNKEKVFFFERPQKYVCIPYFIEMEYENSEIHYQNQTHPPYSLTEMCVHALGLKLILIQLFNLKKSKQEYIINFCDIQIENQKTR